jgi:hypothetical protein
MQARKAWRGQNGQFGKARGYHKRGSDNISNNKFVHNGGGYDCEIFIFQQLFSAGIEPNPGPDSVILSATGEESKSTSTGEGGSSRSAPTAPSNIVQRKRSRATVAMNQQERTARRANQRITANNVQSSRNFDQEFFYADSMRTRTALNAVTEVISSHKKLMKSVCVGYLVFVVANALNADV